MGKVIKEDSANGQSGTWDVQFDHHSIKVSISGGKGRADGKSILLENSQSAEYLNSDGWKQFYVGPFYLRFNPLKIVTTANGKKLEGNGIKKNPSEVMDDKIAFAYVPNMSMDQPAGGSKLHLYHLIHQTISFLF